MNNKARITLALWLGGILSIGAFLAFFFVFRTLFTDAPTNLWSGEMIVAQLLTVVVFAVACLAILRFAPTRSTWWTVPLLVPAALVLVFYGDAAWELRLMTFVAVALGKAIGGTGGLTWRKRHDGTPPAPASSA